MKRWVATGLLMLALAVEAAAAATALDYKERVWQAAGELGRIEEDQTYAQEGSQQIKKLLPRTETVEEHGRVIEVNNTWLHVKLDVYAAASGTAEKERILEGISNSLTYLYKNLGEAEDRDSEQLQEAEMRERLRQILANDKYRERKDGPITALIKRIQKKIGEVFNRLMMKIGNALRGATTQGGWLFRGIFFLAIGAALFVAIRMLMKYRRPRRKKKKRSVLGEEIEEDVQPSDLAEAAMAAAKAGDFRAAMRKLYIAFLYELSEKGLIELEANATNREYLAKVSRFAPLEPPMRVMTDRFDYFWYGMFPSSVEDFSSYHAIYTEALRSARALNEQSATTS